MQDLLDKQERTHGHITRAYDSLKRLAQNNITQGVVEAKITTLDSKWEAFEALHEKIEETTSAEDRKGAYFKENVYATTEYGYFLNKGKFLDLIRQFKGESEAPQRLASNT